MVKADGYGHGAVPCGRAALAGGASWLAVAAASEAAELRARRSPRRDCSCWGRWPRRAGSGFRGRRRHRRLAGRLPRAGGGPRPRARGSPARARQVRQRHGPPRRGDPRAVVELIEQVAASEEVELTGFWTHFATAAPATQGCGGLGGVKRGSTLPTPVVCNRARSATAADHGVVQRRGCSARAMGARPFAAEAPARRPALAEERPMGRRGPSRSRRIRHPGKIPTFAEVLELLPERPTPGSRRTWPRRAAWSAPRTEDARSGVRPREGRPGAPAGTGSAKSWPPRPSSGSSTGHACRPPPERERGPARAGASPARGWEGRPPGGRKARPPRSSRRTAAF